MPPSSGISSAPRPSAKAAVDPTTHADLTAGRLRIRVTTAGTLAILLVLGTGVVAVNSGNNLLYLLVSGLLAALALSGLLGHRNLQNVALRLTPPDEVWARRPVSVRIEVENRRRRWPAFLLAVGVRPDAPTATLLEVPPKTCAQVDLTLAFPARGRRTWPSCTVTSEFPFGLIRRGFQVQPPGACLVYPAPLAVAWESVERAEREGGLQTLRAPGVGGDYRGLRDYRPGDGLSRVQWSSWLRLRRFQTKEFDVQGAPPVVYRFEEVPGPGTEERLGQLAWLVRTSLRRERSVGLILPGRELLPGRGPDHQRALLTALALYEEPA